MSEHEQQDQHELPEDQQSSDQSERFFAEPLFQRETGNDGYLLKQAVEFTKNYMQPELVGVRTPDGVEALFDITRDGVKCLNPSVIDSWRNKPRFRRGCAYMTDATSFIAHMNRFKSEHSAIFAIDDQAEPSLVGVIDYHKKTNAGDPDFCLHRTKFNFPLSKEWKVWSKFNGVPFSQVEFARFLEDNIIDVLAPTDIGHTDDDKVRKFIENLGGEKRIADPSKLMSLSSCLSVHETSKLVSAQNLASGEGRIEFSSEHDTSDKVGVKFDVPTMFAIGIPVFKNGVVYRIMARLRYRKEGPMLKFWYDLWRTDVVFDDAFVGTVDRVASETELPVFLGTDEAVDGHI